VTPVLYDRSPTTRTGDVITEIIIIIITEMLFIVLSSSLWEFVRFIWWMRTKRHVAANPQTKPTILDYEFAGKISYHPHHDRHLLLLSLRADSRFTIPWRVELGWVDLGTAVRVCSPCPRLYIAVTVVINTTARGEIGTWVLSHRSQAC